MLSEYAMMKTTRIGFKENNLHTCRVFWNLQTQFLMYSMPIELGRGFLNTWALWNLQLNNAAR